MKTASILALVLAAGTAIAQNDTATTAGNTGPMVDPDTVNESWGSHGQRSGTIIYDTLNFVDNQTYSAGNGNAYAGQAVFGSISDLMLCDDFRTTTDATLTCVTADYVTFLGANPAGGVQVDVWTDAGGAPGSLVASQTVAVTGFSTFSDTVFGLVGTRISADVNIALNPNTTYFIMIQPIDLSSGGDWYYQVRDLSSFTGADSYGQDGGRGNPGYGVSTWTSMTALGFGTGDAGMQIQAGEGGPNCDAADCDGNGVVDTRDVLCFLNIWSACR